MTTKWIRKSVKVFPEPFTLSKEKTIPATKESNYSENDFWWWASWHPPSDDYYFDKDQYYTDGRFIIIRDREYGDGKVLGWRVIDTRYMMIYPDEFRPHHMGQTIQSAQTKRHNYTQIDTDPPKYKDRDFLYRHITIPYLSGQFNRFFLRKTDKLDYNVDRKGHNNQASFNTLKGAKNFVERLILAEKESMPFGIINMSFSKIGLSYDEIDLEDWI